MPLFFWHAVPDFASLCLLIVGLLVPNMLFSASLGKKAQSEISAIGDMTAGVDSQHKMFYYDQYKKSVAVPLVLNLFVGFGIGLYVEGDTEGGTIALVGDLLSASVYLAGYLHSYNGALENDTDSITRGSFIMVGGLAAIIGFKIFGIVRPFIYANTYNKELSKALNLNSVQLSMMPVLGDDKNLGFSLAAKLSF